MISGGPLRVELWNPRDHFLFVYSWWRARRVGGIDLESLGRQGAMVFQGDKPLAAAWLYLSDCKAAQIGWTVTNPEAGMQLRFDAVEELIRTLSTMAKERGYTRLWNFSSSGGLSRLFEKHGFTRIEQHDFLVKDIT